MSLVTRQRELNRETHSNLELRFEVSVKFSGLDPDPIPTATEIEYRTIANPFVVTSVQFTAIDDPLFNHNWGHITFLQLYFWSEIKKPHFQESEIN